MSDDAPILPRNRVRITAGTFEGFEAVVVAVDVPTATVSAEIHIFGVATPVEVPVGDVQRMPWQAEQ